MGKYNLFYNHPIRGEGLWDLYEDPKMKTTGVNTRHLDNDTIFILSHVVVETFLNVQ